MIRPTAKFVLLQWVPKGDSLAIFLPDGARPTTGGDFVVLAVGPDVPPEPPLLAGTKVLLRGDAAPVLGVDEKKKIGIMHYEWIMAVIEEEPLDLPSDEEIDKMAENKG